ncbi:MAG: GNAT family protein [Bacilli bacterium]|nr:GNAT family protein [Bacilli bacterium]
MENFNGNTILKDENITLRFINIADKTPLFNNLYHNKNVLKYFIAPYYEKEDELNLDKTINYYLNNKLYCFTILYQNEVVGLINQLNDVTSINKTVEIGFAIGEKYWNKGIATTALKMFISFLFSQGIHKVTCAHFIENEASKKVMIQNKMIFEGTRKDDIFYQNRFYDCNYYYLINKEDDLNG